ncbi:helix-turn-helix domain-containing protein [Pontibacter sp. HSC-36F09]|uniref:helix-turn-helix domain-containing protein n=1 Tax=Pontibacter sp. HSC-36F09 TaxID=2910966 RepID=UPI00209F1478|nr:helix-turn-helix domain-containing protein [Pontibacter sp. HSC-36F09]MCP2043487.1 excisionase family DNA binding protein [Pontibacter sp. HSC-36F09]
MELIVTTADQLSTLIQRAVARAIAPTSTPTPKPDRCTLDEALEITGLSKSKLYKLTSLDEIPHRHYGSRLVFSRKELAEWVEEQTVEKHADDATTVLAASARRKQRRG